MNDRRRAPPWQYEKEYHTVDYEGARVLDIGADYGTSAEFFLARGAAHVVGMEANAEWRERMRRWAAGRAGEVTVLDEPLTEANVADVFLEHRPDVVKVDCERCEALLLALSDEILGAPRAWVMETHTQALYEAFAARFRELGYDFAVVREWAFPVTAAGKLCRVVTAIRGGHA